MIIREMFKNILFEPMNEDVKRNLDFSFHDTLRTDFSNLFDSHRKKTVKRRIYNKAISDKMTYSKYLFGFEPNHNTETLLSYLQNIINQFMIYFKADSNINIRCFTRFSDLTKTLMFETGCFEGVLESCGEYNNQVRSSIIFQN